MEVVASVELKITCSDISNSFFNWQFFYKVFDNVSAPDAKVLKMNCDYRPLVIGASSSHLQLSHTPQVCHFNPIRLHKDPPYP